MLDFPLWKRGWFWGLTLALTALALPSIFSLSGARWPAALPDPEVNLGLDLAGGSHILLEADPTEVAVQRLRNMEESVRSTLRRAEPAVSFGDVSTAEGRLSFMVQSVADVDRARSLLEPLLNGEGLVREWNLTVVDETRIVLTPTEAGLEAAVNAAMDSSQDVIDRRINALGTREPTIIRQGENRIVVQVPGLEDPDQVKELVGRTAKLEFKLVNENALQTDLAQGIAEPGQQIFPYAPDSPFFGQNVAVYRLGGIDGGSLIRAQASRNQDNEDVVVIQFDQQGGNRFAKLTSENVGKQFAIVLDGEVISAPVINDRILSGVSEISGSFTPESAQQLAISLQSGALPVDLTVVEERTVGPDLGAESIRLGLLAMLVGSIAVVTLMIASYGRFGVYATIALIFNVLMILGIMALMNTTLTLPGIAGFVLTIGAAVDANVLINERIREERKRGRRVIAAVENGYREASRAIFDANITNFIAGVLLFMFGTGPIRGFAVVLIIGLFTSVFTAVSLTRMWVAGWLRRTRPQDLNI
ncbi:protein translocase subunit SecD [Pelagerythrobacter marensis]|uniref:Protein translocase subunit SecD n=1 Tax=Pelagerythrobacter marensis TaxID=543877 RepID=A0A0G3X835_9SPHN|nr:protein translocase subunit SecD [Pelagerythrobacter marensis]AKM06774.1 Protein translocase subunit SecD [Pelagerythrobacter marensis]